MVLAVVHLARAKDKHRKGLFQHQLILERESSWNFLHVGSDVLDRYQGPISILRKGAVLDGHSISPQQACHLVRTAQEYLATEPLEWTD